MKKRFLAFPKDFMWGASTAAHQVEGNIVNDITEWEKKNAEQLAKKSESFLRYATNFVSTLPPNFDKILEESSNPENYISGDACDHYRRYEEDYTIAAELNHNATRLSIPWERIEPEQGVIDKKEIEHYRKVLEYIISKGMVPMVTLFHYSSPIWFTKKGGWENRKNITLFVKFTELMVEEYKDLVKYWITINEPTGISIYSYLTGIRPPEKKSVLSFLRVNRHLVEGHRKAYYAMKAIQPDAQISMSHSYFYFEAYKNRPFNTFLKSILDRIMNYFFIDSTIKEHDFLGVNYYFHNLIDNGVNKNEYKVVSDMGWELYPEGIYQAMKDVKRYKKPVIITEHGLADKYDKHREWYLKETLHYLHKAIHIGVKIKGYLHWSLIDNFEWDSGFWPRFGLVEIDYKTQKRTIRKSALSFAQIIKNNGFEIDED